MKNNNIHSIIKILKKETKKFRNPVSQEAKKKFRDPFKILISCILSLRTKDVITQKVSEILFKRISTPYELLKIREKELEKIIYPVSFYHKKAVVLKGIARDIIEKFDGEVPQNMEYVLILMYTE